MSEHLPCPFCGEEGFARKNRHYDHIIECDGCEARTSGYSDKESAWAHWDSRSRKESS